MNELTLRQLEYFVAVAETQSITKAAATSHVSQAAVSLALTELEKTLGVTLTIRRPAKGVVLTAEGRAILPEARAILDQTQQLADRASQVRKSLSGPLHIGCFRTLSMHVVPHLVEWFARHHPAVELIFDEDNAQDIQQKMLSGQLSACLIYEAQLEPGCRTVFVQDHRRQAIMSPQHPLAEFSEVSLAQLADFPAVLLSEQPALERTLNEFYSRSLDPKIAARTRSVQTVQNLVGRNFGYGVLMHASSSSPEGRPLITRNISDSIPRNALMLALPPGHTTAAVRALEACLQELPNT
ncbi:LysR family transcriptional regulator [Enteractinococcus coprophilus]|uniref:LysR family transcriptional regulator n=1 Tax=Enteractinococcus coprophilus TaxID=1027633 RepID=A0A543AMT4_9MICC|nr:LysR family transcriptional regulator [Enteractinococcus coprophilus]TQL73901.1 LysR family transcriptional regulator [Enteractinococcus coprophilus]